MTTILKNTYKEQNISVIKTNKFKNITINMRFALEFSVKRKAVLYLLSAMMFQSTNRFLKDLNELDYLSFIDEILHNPLFTLEKLAEAKNNLKSNIKRKLDNPQNLANDNFYGEISKDDKRF